MKRISLDLSKLNREIEGGVVFLKEHDKSAFEVRLDDFLSNWNESVPILGELKSNKYI